MPGDVISCAGVRAGGRHLALAASRSIRNWPPGRGGWSYSITIDPPAGLADGVGRLLDHLGWEGIFEVELLTDAGGGFRTIDLNPRPYGSLALAIAAGANLPEAWASWVLGREPAYRRGARGSSLPLGGRGCALGASPPPSGAMAGSRGHRPAAPRDRSRVPELGRSRPIRRPALWKG